MKTKLHTYRLEEIAFLIGGTIELEKRAVKIGNDTTADKLALLRAKLIDEQYDIFDKAYKAYNPK